MKRRITDGDKSKIMKSYVTFDVTKFNEDFRMAVEGSVVIGFSQKLVEVLSTR